MNQVVAVGDEADALGEERFLDLDFSPVGPSCARRGEAGELVDQVALAPAPQREANLSPAEGRADRAQGERISVAAKQAAAIR